MMTTIERPTPCVDDPDTGGFFEANARGEVALRACEDCGRILHLPKAFCHGCGGWNTRWRVVQPSGVVWSWTTTVRQLNPAFEPPYTVVLVELDDAPGARLAGHLAGEPELEVGMPMRAVFEHLQDGSTIVQWEPVG